MRRTAGMLAAMAIVLLCFGCTTPRITLFSDASDPLREVTLEGTAEDKIVMIPISGVITDSPKSRIIRTHPGTVQEVVSHLRLAEQDPRVKAVLFTIDSPGGSTTASDILYHEIAAFKARSAKTVAVCMMGLATSGGYYVALPADLIMAHPTTVTGSVGVMLVRPEITGLMETIGVAVQVNKSGENKDMGSPFRNSRPNEEVLLQELTDALGKRFIDLVQKHRQLDPNHLRIVADARVFLAESALAMGLVDQIGYLRDAIAEVKSLADLDTDARVVAYRRTDYPDDNLYNTLTSGTRTQPALLPDTGIIGTVWSLEAGFYYLWPPTLGSF